MMVQQVNLASFGFTSIKSFQIPAPSLAVHYQDAGAQAILPSTMDALSKPGDRAMRAGPPNSPKMRETSSAGGCIRVFADRDRLVDSTRAQVETAQECL